VLQVAVAKWAGMLSGLIKESGNLTASKMYRNGFSVHRADSAKEIASNGGDFDLIVTSPPYGDNLTTVPYGQASYLPLQWIDFADIGNGRISTDCLDTTFAIDRSSIGGSTGFDWRLVAEELAEDSPSFESLISRISGHDRHMKVVSFFQDMKSAFSQTVNVMKPNAYMIMTVGNRRVGGVVVPTDAILGEILEHCGMCPVHSANREIPYKRMARRNSIAKTINTELVMVYRKPVRGRD
jgi:hypothetical protein